MIDMQQIGTKIAKLRKEKGMTQTELAERLRVTHQAVSKWERGISLPDLPTFVQLSLLFGVRTDELLGLTTGGEGVPAEADADTQLPVRLEDLDADKVWSEVKAHIKRNISGPSYNTWIHGTSAIIEDGSLIVVCGGGLFQKDWLLSRYNKMVMEELKHVTGLTDIQLSYRVSRDGGYGAVHGRQ